MPNSQRKVVKCAVRGCKISDKDDVSLHPFPKSPKTLWIKWVKCCSTHSGWRPGARSAICSKHFEPSLFKKMPNNQQKLLEGAVPTLFLRGENQVCRVCLAVEDSLHPIAESGLKHMYEQCCGLSLLSGVSLPQQVCSACMSKLQAAWSLRTTAQSAYMILVKLLTQENYNNKTITEIVQQGDGNQYKMVSLLATNNFEFVDITQQQQKLGLPKSQQLSGPPKSQQMPGSPKSQQMPGPPKSQQMPPPSRLRQILTSPMPPLPLQIQSLKHSKQMPPPHQKEQMSIPPPYKMPQQQQMPELPQPQEDRRAYRSASPTKDADKVLHRNVPPREPVTNIDTDVIVIDADEETNIENVISEQTVDMIDIVEHKLQPETDINTTTETELEVIKPVTYIIRNDQDENDLADLDLTQDVTDESDYDSEATESADEAAAFMSDADSNTGNAEYEFVAVPNTGIAFTVVDEIKPQKTVSNRDGHFTGRIENVYSIKEENTKKLLLGDYNDNLNNSDWKKLRRKNISTRQ